MNVVVKVLRAFGMIVIPVGFVLVFGAVGLLEGGSINLYEAVIRAIMAFSFVSGGLVILFALDGMDGGRDNG